ncbi:hypothetical protein Desca_1034 [Desulfotomaculum nigrificans CO-1-SRB]|uniref:Uncharacterized protein n=1 Tax=Desulfotomaculum nigrificans (strain DSM 14880 / VKM B-2319 / CO-1-SRB) TaxID=868595 RepID=F6B301_DESCC|nr:hypothetical protein [Desulfotomaculum nigrificans]AEF93905.1 hypothetical protein Desca_1034 [Desulfotomaculum nigrificans CO-1-SRB]
MFAEIEEIKKQCEEEIISLQRQIYMAKRSLFFRWDSKAIIQQAEAKVEKIQELLVKLEGLTDQIVPVVNDIKEIIGYKKAKQM